jgi:hypothetical protein
VSPSLSPLLAYSQIAIALKLRHCAPSSARTPPSPIVDTSLAGDFTVTSARHLAVDWPSRAPSDQINPSTVIPYACSCLTTIPSTQNRTTSEEPSRNFTGDRFSPPRTASPPASSPLTSFPLLAGTWARAHSAVPAPSPAGGSAGPPARARAHARAPRSARPKSPLAQLAGNHFSFPFSISFSYFHVFMHILIFYAPKIV